MSQPESDLVSSQSVLKIHRATSDEEALAAEMEFLEQTDNGAQPEDPEDQPVQAAAGVGAGGPAGVGSQAMQVIGLAAKEIGLLEVPVNRTKFGKWYGGDGQPWCAMFVSWCFDQAGFPQPASTSKGFAFTPAGAAWYKKMDSWGTEPQPGAVVFFKFAGGPNRIHHVGLVAGVHGGVIETIEGNTSSGKSGSQRDGGGVFRRRRSSGIVGYGYPIFGGEQPPKPLDGAAKERVKELQGLLGVKVDGDFGDDTGKACNQHLIGFQAEVTRKKPSAPTMENREDLVRFLKRQMNRRFGYGLDESSTAVGAKVNHGIVVGLGQADSMCGRSGYLTAVL